MEGQRGAERERGGERTREGGGREKSRERGREGGREFPPMGEKEHKLEDSQASPARPSGSSSVWIKGLKL